MLVALEIGLYLFTLYSHEDPTGCTSEGCVRRNEITGEL